MTGTQSIRDVIDEHAVSILLPEEASKVAMTGVDVFQAFMSKFEEFIAADIKDTSKGLVSSQDEYNVVKDQFEAHRAKILHSTTNYDSARYVYTRIKKIEAIFQEITRNVQPSEDVDSTVIQRAITLLHKDKWQEVRPDVCPRGKQFVALEKQYVETTGLTEYGKTLRENFEVYPNYTSKLKKLCETIITHIENSRNVHLITSFEFPVEVDKEVKHVPMQYVQHSLHRLQYEVYEPKLVPFIRQGLENTDRDLTQTELLRLKKDSSELADKLHGGTNMTLHQLARIVELSWILSAIRDAFEKTKKAKEGQVEDE